MLKGDTNIHWGKARKFCCGIGVGDISMYVFRIFFFFYIYSLCVGVSQVALVVKNPPADAGDVGSIPGLARSPEGGHGNPLQYSCLENPMDRGAWLPTVHTVVQSQTRLK